MLISKGSIVVFSFSEILLDRKWKSNPEISIFYYTFIEIRRLV